MRIFRYFLYALNLIVFVYFLWTQKKSSSVEHFVADKHSQAILIQQNTDVFMEGDHHPKLQFLDILQSKLGDLPSGAQVMIQSGVSSLEVDKITQMQLPYKNAIELSSLRSAQIAQFITKKVSASISVKFQFVIPSFKSLSKAASESSLVISYIK